MKFQALFVKDYFILQDVPFHNRVRFLETWLPYLRELPELTGMNLDQIIASRWHFEIGLGRK